MGTEWRERLREMIDADGRSLRAISKAAGFGENYVQQMLKDEKDPAFSKLASVLATLGPGATLYVTSGLRLSPTKDLRSALIAYGVDRDDIEPAMRAIRGFVSDHHDDELQQSDQPHDQPAHASRRRAKEPSG